MIGAATRRRHEADHGRPAAPVRGLVAVTALIAIVALLGVDRASALGQITFGGCVSQSGTGGRCASVAGDPLFAPSDVAISPDGDSAYTTAYQGSAVAVFDRASAGQLTYAGCISNTGSGGACADIPGSPFITPSTVAVSPDGTTVYVGTLSSDVVAVFDRAPGGQLTWAGCVGNEGEGGVCADLPGQPMTDIDDLAVSPDGKSVYVVAHTSGTVTVLDRAPGGQLTYGGCMSGNGSGGSCGTGGPALSTPEAVTVAPDGKSVFVADAASDSVLMFQRSAGGQLVFAECLSNTGTGGWCVDVPGSPLDGAMDVAVDDGGTSVYVAASTASAVAVFDRDNAVTYAGCVSDDGSGGRCADVGGDTFTDIESVEVSPDGGSVYAGSVTSDSVSVLDRAAGGQITYGGCVSAGGSGETCGTANASLDYPRALAISPDGGSLYTVAFNSNAVQHYHRKTAPETTIESGPAEGETVTDPNPGFGFSADQDGASFECSLDGGAFEPCVSPKSAGAPADGLHRFAVRAITGGDPDPTPATRSYRVDTTGPKVRITRAPRRRVVRIRGRRAQVEVAFESREAGATFECRLDAGRFRPCASPRRYRLSTGRHRIAVRAIDAVGNAGPAERTRLRVVRAERG